MQEGGRRSEGGVGMEADIEDRGGEAGGWERRKVGSLQNLETARKQILPRSLP